MKKNYWEKLQDPRWQKLRLEAMESKGFSCELCGDNESLLNVHHKEYFSGRNPWEYYIEQLAVLCNTCHETEHSKIDLLKEITSCLPLDGPLNRLEIGILLAGYTNQGLESCLHLIGNDAKNEFFSKLYKAGDNAFIFLFGER